jgi:hypothetical protein
MKTNNTTTTNVSVETLYTTEDQLKSVEGREKAFRKIEEAFITALRSKGVELSDEATCRVYQDSIQLGIAAKGKYAEKGYRMAFGSIITLYVIKHDAERGDVNKENKMYYGTFGAFTPSDKESYWRTMHAAAVLSNWEIVSEIVNRHTQIYDDLINKIFSVLGKARESKNK